MQNFRHWAWIGVALGVLGIAPMASSDARAQSAPLSSFVSDILVSAPNGLNLPAVGGHPGLTVPVGGTVTLGELAAYSSALRAQQMATLQQSNPFPGLSAVPGTTIVTLSPPENNVMRALWSMPFEVENLATIFRINRLEPAERSTALERLTSVPGTGAGSGGFTHAANLSSQLGQRLASLRNGATDTGFAARQLAGSQLASSETDPEAIITAYTRAKAADGFPLVSGFALPDEIGVFASGNLSFGDSDALGGQEDYTTKSVTAGVDYRLMPTLVVGIAGTYSATSTDVSYGGDTESRTIGGSLYGTWYQDNWYTDLYAGAATTDTDIRRVTPIGAASLESTAETDGIVMTAGGRIGRNFQAGDFTFSPFAALDYVRTKTDGYTETGAGAFSLIVPETTATSFKTSLGGQAAFTFDMGGHEMAPYANAAWVREFHDDAPITTVAFSGAPTATFQSVGRSPEANWAQVGAGISTRFSKNLLLNLGANTDLGRADIRRTQISLSLRAAF